MNFGEIQDEVIAIRFRESQRDSVRLWINLRSQGIWTIADWPFKFVYNRASSVTPGSTSIDVPSDFYRPIAVYDQAGLEIPQFTREVFYDTFMPGLQAGHTGSSADAYTWAGVNDPNSWRPYIDLTMYPIADSDHTYRLNYERIHSYFTEEGSSDISYGDMSNSDNAPIWDQQFHYILVLGAIATGLRLENDPTYDALEEEFQATLQLMREFYLPTQLSTAGLQYGRDDLGI